MFKHLFVFSSDVILCHFFVSFTLTVHAYRPVYIRRSTGLSKNKSTNWGSIYSGFGNILSSSRKYRGWQIVFTCSNFYNIEFIMCTFSIVLNSSTNLLWTSSLRYGRDKCKTDFTRWTIQLFWWKHLPYNTALSINRRPSPSLLL
jgi:hypothetical protein